MRKAGFILAATLVWPGASALAADAAGTVARVYVTAPRPGMVGQYEAGRKKHMDFHRKQGDAWAWFVWQVETGPNAGSYYAGSFGHQWKDLDDWEKKMGAADTADGAINLAPSSSGNTNSLYNYLPDISRPGGPTPSPMAEVMHYQLNMGAEEDFKAAARKIHDAIGKAGLDWHYGWYELVDGGEHPTYVLSIAMNGWADMAPSDPTFPAMLAKAYGEDQARELLKTIDRSVKSLWSEIITYRADLSYVPAAK
jgi:hypothetical protein